MVTEWNFPDRDAVLGVREVKRSTVTTVHLVLDIHDENPSKNNMPAIIQFLTAEGSQPISKRMKDEIIIKKNYIHCIHWATCIAFPRGI